MARRVFYSFHYKPDGWRASKVRNIGVVEGNVPASDNDWEAITGKGDAAIQAWIDGQLSGRSCTLVLIGANTANRKWINYEIKTSWNERKGLAGIYIHNITDRNENQSSKGANPFAEFTVGSAKTPMSSIVKAYDPPFSASKDVYKWISDNLSKIVEEGVTIREKY